MKRNDVILQKMLTYARNAQSFTMGVTRQDFDESIEKQYAICLALLQVGEMVSLLPDSFRNSYPDIPWRSIKGLRNVIAHNYSSVDENLLWQLISQDLPVLIAALEQITPASED